MIATRGLDGLPPGGASTSSMLLAIERLNGLPPGGASLPAELPRDDIASSSSSQDEDTRTLQIYLVDVGDSLKLLHESFEASDVMHTWNYYSLFAQVSLKREHSSEIMNCKFGPYTIDATTS